MKKINIATQPVCLYGRNIPIGGMWGYDSKGIWICTDYHIKSMRTISKAHYIKVRDESGNFVSIMVSPAKVKPVLKLFRIKQRGINNESNYRVDWVKKYEHGATVDLILDTFENNESACEIRFDTPTKKKLEYIDGEWKVTKKATFKDSEVTKAASGIAMRSMWKDFVPYDKRSESRHKKGSRFEPL